MSKTKIVKETLETWKGGKADGYFEPLTNEIHILQGKDVEFRTEIHEKVHADRQNKLTFKLGSLLQISGVSQFIFAVMIILGIAGAATQALIPFFFIAGIFTVLIFCYMFEELRADQVMLKSMKEIKRGNET